MSSARQIGPYEVVREIARGGMGIVFEVRHPSSNRRLALKLMLNAEGARGADQVQRFEREAEILARCDRHPNVLKVHQLGKLEGRLFLVTELVEGEALQRALRMEPRRAATIIRKVADALAYVHSRGVLHRDVKPDNILLRAGEPDSPVLVDFGLAWVGDVERLTRTGTTLGTPAFMSPEQASVGQGALLDARTDVYSLGATLYAALTGDGPFIADSMPTLVAKILTEPARPPGEVTPGIPAALDAICLHALEKDAARRYPDAAALRDDLDRFLRGERPLALGLVAAPPRVRIRRLVVGVVLAALVVAALGLGFVAFRTYRKHAAYQSALAVAVEASRAAAKSRHNADGAVTLTALERALAQLDATPAPVGERQAPAQRVRTVAALLRAEALAREGGTPDDRARSLALAATSARAYLAAAASLGIGAASAAGTERRPVNTGSGTSGVVSTEAPSPSRSGVVSVPPPGDTISTSPASAEPHSGADELEGLGEREPALAAALATWTADDEVVRALLARPEAHEPTRVARLDRARAFLALGEPLLARKSAELVTGDDATGLEARLLAARANLEAGDLARARPLVAPLATGGDPIGRARAVALLTSIDLARGQPLAAQAALDAEPTRPGAAPEQALELELARADVALVRQAPAEVVVQTLEALEKRIREAALAPRLAELEGRARVLAELESFEARSALPTFEAARASFLRAIDLGQKPGGGDARAYVARASLELAALDELQGRPAEAAAGRLRAGRLAPFSVEAALALTDDVGSARGPLPETLRALERTAAATADEAVASALRGLATAARTSAAPRSALVAIEPAAGSAQGARERGLLGLLLARLSPHPDRPDQAAKVATEQLRRCGALEALLLEQGRQRIEIARHAESYLLHSLAVLRSRERESHPPTWGRGAAGEINDGLAAERDSLARGDAPLAVMIFDLALALRPSLVGAVRERARAVAQTIRGGRPDLVETKPFAEGAALARAFVGADGGLARARGALVALEAVDLPSDALAHMEAQLARGRLLLLTGRAADAIPILRKACDEAGALAIAGRAAERPRHAVIGLAEGTLSEALQEISGAQSGALEASGAHGDSTQDLEDRGASIAKTLAFCEELNKVELDMGEFGERDTFLSQKCEALRTQALNEAGFAPYCTDVLGKCAMSELTAARVIVSYETWHDAFEARGPLPANLMIIRREFGPHFRKESTMSQLTVADVKVNSDTAADDAAALAATASRSLFALGTGPDPGARRVAARGIEDDLARAARLSPSFVALEAFRGFADVAAGEIECARARFRRLEMLSLASTQSRKMVQMFAATCYARFGHGDEAKKTLIELRDGQEVDPSDAVTIRGEAFDDIRAIPELVPLVQEIDRLFLSGENR